ncbi:BN860_12794g1_1 [Zygosaccharomyces bailii CLIB 213]|uniref:BN860_12794g1_1 n=1 Tax=Zygosaccharomyces bailii (strain CLIB 213 / ATCC 58445 / CBS 680 / BCRC 21525 / NBRC 1098 / NCYC 1416 / NRRL Y-2227) TaxID=1333698 RepID=A0A8J2T4H6_ZYGB2|nr:BN860_12794g1_1 [Zygosaccharomyces bailii CLIB 213]
MATSGIRIAIDRGGTFTDCVGNPGTGRQEDDVVIKLLSVDPKNYADAPLEAIRRLLGMFSGKEIARGVPLDMSGVSSIRMGTTLATNCALERNGEPCAFVTTKGFRDVIVIGNQSRPDIFDLNIKKPKPLYETVIEVDERVTLEDFSEDPLNHRSVPCAEQNTVLGTTGEVVRIVKALEVEEVRRSLRRVYESGIRSVAVALLHSYTYPGHEQLVGRIAREIGFKHVSLSCEVSPMIKHLPRAHSAVADAYLTPVIKKYLESMQSGLVNVENTSIQFMQSDGGLVEGHRFSGLKSILSGPAGGVVGYSSTCYDAENGISLIGFDMGGTSTDVSRFGDGKLEHVFETTTAGIVIQSPQLNINTVAAGGSSRLFWENGLFRVGPESATADPGPAAYRKGGPLTITDANLVLGRLVPEFFPRIFGPNEDESLDLEATRKKFDELTGIINEDMQASMRPEEVALGFLKVANESMARPIRAITENKGHVVSKHRLVTFGGAGGQHAVAVAESLGIREVVAHRYSSILSAYGIFLADVVEENQEPCFLLLNEEENVRQVELKLERLVEKSEESLKAQGFEKDHIFFEKYLNLRYEGTETSLMILEESNQWDFEQWFAAAHKREFGFAFSDKNIIVDDIRVRAVGKSHVRKEESVDDQLKRYPSREVSVSREASFFKDVFFDNVWVRTPVYRIDDMRYGSVVKGPAILADGTQTNIIPANSVAHVLKSHIFIEILHKSGNGISGEPEFHVDPIMLSIFSHRFMDIAEQMGMQLQKTSVSTNVKERLDFSCALFDPEGNLVANAPHLPVHLGSMSTCIAAQARLWKGRLKPGDVLMSNHPDIGGTHLPDITVISPAFSESSGKLIFYVASRAHHADIGGILPGSVPPNSKELYEEGAAIYSELIVREGVLQEAAIRRLLLEEPAKYPRCSGSRRISDNISDINAQIAANNKGIQLISKMISESGLDVIVKYMTAIQENAAQTIKKMLQKLTEHFGETHFSGEDRMDDGTVIKLAVSLDIEKEEYVFDFEGTSPQVYGNLNAPEAITYSAILYCLRCLVGEDIPLNQGCLKPIIVKIPKGSILSPINGIAVVGGNVLTSQRVTDVVLKTFHVMADSQGDCNNFTFGTGGRDPETGVVSKGFGYYETICGGHGAGADSWRGAGWNGTSAVHTNMTNTRMTDSEVFERRYPVLLREFSVRTGSGGKGRYTGGDGAVRDIEFRKPVEASVLSERRVIAPHGLNGGNDGQRGLNLWIRDQGKNIINIGGKNSVKVTPGDRILLMTPGGGGCGKAE